jgi:hypothetical protein
MLSIVAGLLWVLSGQASAREARIVQISCFDDQTIVGVTSAHHVVIREGSVWRALPTEGDRLWHSPDDRMFVIGSGPFVEELAHGHAAAPVRWNLPSALALPRLAFVDGVVAVTQDHLFRLEPGGKPVGIGSTPTAPDGIARIPAIIDDRGRLIACFQTSYREADAAQGECLAPTPHGYEYLVDFGDFGALEKRRFATPFVCGDAIISVHQGVTRSRDLATGRPVAKVAGGALEGSRCIAGNRAVLLGEKNIRIVEAPGLRRLWRKDLQGPIDTATICGERLAFISTGRSDVSFVDLAGPRGEKPPRLPAEVRMEQRR